MPPRHDVRAETARSVRGNFTSNDQEVLLPFLREGIPLSLVFFLCDCPFQAKMTHLILILLRHRGVGKRGITNCSALMRLQESVVVFINCAVCPCFIYVFKASKCLLVCKYASICCLHQRQPSSLLHLVSIQGMRPSP